MQISEYIRRKDMPVPLEVVDKIQKWHAMPMCYVREVLGSPVFVSQASGFRPVEHEKERGRNGLSEHTFNANPSRQSPGYGAADYRCEESKMLELAKLIKQLTPYHRLCFYPDVLTPFIHADYRFYGLRDRTYFISMAGEWKSVTWERFLDEIKKTYDGT